MEACIAPLFDIRIISVAQLWALPRRMRILAPGNEASFSLRPFAMIILALTLAHHACVYGHRQTERNETKRNVTERNAMKRHCATLPFLIVRSLVKRNGIVLNDFGNVFLTRTVH